MYKYSTKIRFPHIPSKLFKIQMLNLVNPPWPNGNCLFGMSKEKIRTSSTTVGLLKKLLEEVYKISQNSGLSKGQKRRFVWLELMMLKNSHKMTRFETIFLNVHSNY